MTPAEALGVEALEDDNERLRLELVREGRRLSQCREALDRALGPLAEITRAHDRLATTAARAALEVARLTAALDSVLDVDHIGDAHELATDALRPRALRVKGRQAPEGRPGTVEPAQSGTINDEEGSRGQ